MSKYARYGYPAFIAVMLVLPAALDPRWLAVGITFLVFSIVALSQDIVLGKGGMFNMGQALFFGLGAYTTAIMNSAWKVSVVWTLPLAVVIPVVAGILIAGPIVHLRGDYLLVTTIGFNIVLVQALQNDIFGLTGGPNGIFGLDNLKLFGVDLGSQTAVYYLALGTLLLTFWIMHNLDTSKAGRALHYLREDQLAAQAIGINTRVYKIFAFAVGAGIAGLAGAIYAIQYAAVSPEAFNFIQSVLFFAIVIVGGSSIPGVLTGVLIMFVLPEVFREFSTWRYFVFGFAMIVAMILRPRGIFPAQFGKLPKYLKEEQP